MHCAPALPDRNESSGSVTPRCPSSTASGSRRRTSEVMPSDSSCAGSRRGACQPNSTMLTAPNPSRTDLGRPADGTAGNAGASGPVPESSGAAGRRPASPPSWSRRAVLGTLAAPAATLPAPWAEFLGNGALSLADGRAIPVEWSDERNLQWKTDLPGYGQSSPVAVGGKAFVTGVDGPSKEALLVTAVSLESGQPLWIHRSASFQRIKDSRMVSKAAPTPAVDAFFETGNLLAISHDGDTLWERKLAQDFGEFGGRHGIGSSLRLCHAGVLALVAHDRPSYLISAILNLGIWGFPECLRKVSKAVWHLTFPSGICELG